MHYHTEKVPVHIDVSQEEADERAKVIWDAVRRWRDMVPRPSLAELGRMKLVSLLYNLLLMLWTHL